MKRDGDVCRHDSLVIPLLSTSTTITPIIEDTTINDDNYNNTSSVQDENTTDTGIYI